MDFIRLRSLTANPTELSWGQSIEGYESALWVERYRDPGEFKLEGRLSSGLLTKMPLGSFLTHMDTKAIMVVENHEIKQPIDEDPTIIITGRCITSYLENRQVDDEIAYTDPEVQEVVRAANETWDQALTMMNIHIIDASSTYDPGNDLVGVAVNHTCSGPVTIEERVIRSGNVYDAIQDILVIDDLGLKSVRPTPTDPLTYFTVYRGTDVSKKVRFSWMRGDLDNIEHLISEKKLKTRALIKGRWLQTNVNPTGATGWNRRTMMVDASDLDEKYSSVPTGLTGLSIVSRMQVRGREALKKQKLVTITQADVSANTTYRFRRDYNLGDLVTVDGDYGSATVMRVVEFAEADDETGSSGHPTLAIPGEE